MNFIFMLTHNDTTVPLADKVYEGLRGTALRYVGFKDIGATPEELAVVDAKAHADGLEVFRRNRNWHRWRQHATSALTG